VVTKPSFYCGRPIDFFHPSNSRETNG